MTKIKLAITYQKRIFYQLINQVIIWFNLVIGKPIAYVSTIFVLLYFIRFYIAISMGLMPQDAYYFFYSEHLALSYFDHPPMVAYMIKIFGFIFGKSVVSIKLTNFIMTIFSLIGFYHLSKIFLSKEKAIITTLFYGSTFLITVLSLNTTPDVPLMFFWTMSTIALYKAIFINKWPHWVLAGIFIGLSFNSKYTGLFLLTSLILFLCFSKQHRKFLFSKELFLAILFFLITISPVIIWNFKNDWVSFTFQSTDRVNSISNFEISPKFFFGNLGLQMLLLLPILFTSLVFIINKLIKKYWKNWQLLTSEMLFLILFSIPIIGFFFTISMVYWVKLNWIMPAYITALILAGKYLHLKWLRLQITLSLVLHIILLFQIISYPVIIKSDDTWFGWKVLANNVVELKKQYPNSFLFSNDNYKTSAILNYYLEERVFSGNIIGKPALQFSIVDNDLTYLKGQNAIFIDSDKQMKSLDKKQKIIHPLNEYFDNVTQLEPIFIANRQGKFVRKFLVYACFNYHPNKKNNLTK